MAEKHRKESEIGPDPNMETALQWGSTMVAYPHRIFLPYWFGSASVAEYVNAVDHMLVKGDLLEKLNPYEASARCNTVAYALMGSIRSRVAYDMTLPSDPMDAMRVAASAGLRLWSGCISAAKVIAIKTRSGVNTPEYRQGAFRSLHRKAQGDALFRAGLEAAVEFKRMRNEKYRFDGVEQHYIHVYYPRIVGEIFHTRNAEKTPGKSQK